MLLLGTTLPILALKGEVVQNLYRDGGGYSEKTLLVCTESRYLRFSYNIRAAHASTCVDGRGAKKTLDDG